MTKLNDKDQELLSKNRDVICNGAGEDCRHIYDCKFVEDLLLQKQTEIDELKSRICDLECCLNEIVTENCCRDPESLDGFPLSPDRQDDILIADAMKLLSKG